MKKLLMLLVWMGLIGLYGFAGADETRTCQHLSVTVTSTASTIIPGNGNGQHIFIANNDSSGIVYLNMSGTATVSSDMLVLEPGDKFSAANVANSVSAIGSVASNGNVAVLVCK